MKDKLLVRLMKSREFNQLTSREKAIDPQDYDYQKKNFGKPIKEV